MNEQMNKLIKNNNKTSINNDNNVSGYVPLKWRDPLVILLKISCKSGYFKRILESPFNAIIWLNKSRDCSPGIIKLSAEYWWETEWRCKWKFLDLSVYAISSFLFSFYFPRCEIQWNRNWIICLYELTQNVD